VTVCVPAEELSKPEYVTPLVLPTIEAVVLSEYVSVIVTALESKEVPISYFVTVDDAAMPVTVAAPDADTDTVNVAVFVTELSVYDTVIVWLTAAAELSNPLYEADDVTSFVVELEYVAVITIPVESNESPTVYAVFVGCVVTAIFVRVPVVAVCPLEELEETSHPAASNKAAAHTAAAHRLIYILMFMIISFISFR
jgi:hypothetical protein